MKKFTRKVNKTGVTPDGYPPPVGTPAANLKPQAPRRVVCALYLEALTLQPTRLYSLIENMMSMEIISLVLSVLAIVISAVSIYLQYMVEGPKIELLNAADLQRRVPRYHEQLPKQIQEAYPRFPDAAPGYAFVKLVFGNSGDRVGIANIQSMKAKIIESGQDKIIKTAYDKYILVPAYAIVEKDILLSNIQITENTIELSIELTIEYGGYNPKNTEYVHQGTIQKNLRVTLAADYGDPWLIS